MTATASKSKPPLEESIKQHYPSWPWVDLGQSIEGGMPEQVVTLHGPVTNEQLKTYVDLGRLKVQTLVEGNIDDFDRLAMQAPWNCEPDPSGHKHQRKVTANHCPDTEWSSFDLSECMDNHGVLKCDAYGRLVNDYDVVVDRRLDYVLSILENLAVGMADDKAWKKNGKIKWERPRTANSLIYPHGPNMFLRIQQDKSYSYMPHSKRNDVKILKADATDAMQQVLFNVFDGLIILCHLRSPTEWRDSSSGSKDRSIPPPEWNCWRDIVWHGWSVLHNAGPHHNTLGSEFAQPDAPRILNDKFRQRIASGRPASTTGAGLSFYQSIKKHIDLPLMKPFLNHVIFCGSAVKFDDSAIIQACLESRGSNAGKAPLWGHHETFDIGHWAFYAMLSTRIGKELAWFLAEHKSLNGLGHKLISSVTIFAADTSMTVPGPDGSPIARLIKWPVVLWHVVDFDGTLITKKIDLEKKYTIRHDHEQNRRLSDQDKPRPWVFPNIACPQLATGTSPEFPRVVLPSSMTYEGNALPGNIVFSELYDGQNTIYL